MDRFIEFDSEVSMDELERALAVNNPGIMILRFSKLTGTVKVRALQKVSHRELKRAFLPYKIRRIYHDFPISKHTSDF